MKFYDPDITAIGINMRQAKDGGYAKRTDAEQAAKDAVEMAKIAREERMFHLLMKKGISASEVYKDEKMRKSRAIIERYEGAGNGSK